jgi:hypothetical protein
MHVSKTAATFLLFAVGTYAQTHYDFDLTLSAYKDRAASLESTHRISNIHGYVSGGKTLYTATWEPTPADAIDRIVYVGLTRDEWNYHSSWNVSEYQILVLNSFSDEAGENKYNLVYERAPDPSWKQRYTATVLSRSKLAEHLAEWAASKSTRPYRPLWISSWMDAAGLDRYNVVYGPDDQNPDDYRGNIFATEANYYQSAWRFQETVVSSAVRGMSPVTLSVVPWYGERVFAALWRKTAEVNSYPQWSLYREIEREEMEQRLADAVKMGGLVRDLVAYQKGAVEGEDDDGTLLYAAIVDNLPPAVQETYLPGQPRIPPRTTTTSKTSTTLSCPPSSTSSWTTTTRATMTTTTTAKATTTTTSTTTATATKTTTTKPASGWVRVTGLPGSLKNPGA